MNIKEMIIGDADLLGSQTETTEIPEARFEEEISQNSKSETESWGEPNPLMLLFIQLMNKNGLDVEPMEDGPWQFEGPNNLVGIFEELEEGLLMRIGFPPKIEKVDRVSILELINTLNQNIVSSKFYIDNDGCLIGDSRYFGMDEPYFVDLFIKSFISEILDNIVSLSSEIKQHFKM